MTTSTTNPRFPLTPITHISAVPERVRWAVATVDMGARYRHFGDTCASILESLGWEVRW
jgi:hypothetical protein